MVKWPKFDHDLYQEKQWSNNRNWSFLTTKLKNLFWGVIKVMINFLIIKFNHGEKFRGVRSWS